eukprot:CAMPEP_0184187596 /NCGR_PEP_ID=MMETSP0976-20121227/1018_1 /TAXON_ID=483370 /ORGANISM="non described non described, Strain CCMP2097" /LENGTH=169 /DNA_ID=CAMNT_0026491919 /DNA_START=1 /DNA_END=509 /DNA_ORIENTATION=+
MEAVPPANRKRLKLDLILKTLEATTQRGSDVPVLTKNALELVAELCTVKWRRKQRTNCTDWVQWRRKRPRETAIRRAARREAQTGGPALRRRPRFVVTARARADDEARVESREFITPADIEATLPEMLADFEATLLLADFWKGQNSSQTSETTAVCIRRPSVIDARGTC